MVVGSGIGIVNNILTSTFYFLEKYGMIFLIIIVLLWIVKIIAFFRLYRCSDMSFKYLRFVYHLLSNLLIDTATIFMVYQYGLQIQTQSGSPFWLFIYLLTGIFYILIFCIWGIINDIVLCGIQGLFTGNYIKTSRFLFLCIPLSLILCFFAIGNAFMYYGDAIEAIILSL